MLCWFPFQIFRLFIIWRTKNNSFSTCHKSKVHFFCILFRGSLVTFYSLTLNNLVLLSFRIFLGAIAERTKYLAYIIFSFFNTFVFCFPAHWVWSKHGWLNKLGVVDVAGDGPVHLVGGATSLVAAIMIKPRARRFTPEDDHQMGSPTGALLGLFILW